ncbi:hypothetical protein DMY87_18215 [Rhizobium wuzhouense]|uniref:DUF1499 domain-containing protein n=1 Tax=Rhizobium wuzhouense TaxID=1986026 RepID=A0ABX5NMH5_9HYPH|nr:hypothetical protein DMY87_18215 [Rhizobium wuzhouense]
MVALPVLICLAGPSSASDQEELAACDYSISQRQPVPSLFRRGAFTRDQHDMDRTEVESHLKALGVRPTMIQRRLAEFDEGTFRPRIITFIIDYEATATDATIVAKRSECVIRLNRPDGRIIPDLASVDGLTLDQFRARQ